MIFKLQQIKQQEPKRDVSEADERLQDTKKEPVRPWKTIVEQKLGKQWRESEERHPKQKFLLAVAQKRQQAQERYQTVEKIQSETVLPASEPFMVEVSLIRGDRLGAPRQGRTRESPRLT